jgi:hypothetical protein
MRPEILTWLMQGEAWLRQAVLETRGEADDDSRRRAATDPLVTALVSEVDKWPWGPLNSHKAVGHPLHQLCFLADLGIGAEEIGLNPLLEDILAAQAIPGPLRMPMAIPPRYGGSGAAEMSWVLCDAPLLTWALVRLGKWEDPRVQGSALALNAMARSNGWPCLSCPELKGFRGPGRKSDPCPYANLIMLQLNADLPNRIDSAATRAGVETALGLWERSREEHPYMFFMGTDFRKAKAPLAWYDILHVADVLSRFPWARKDERLRDMVGVLVDQAGNDGRYTAGSIWTRWNQWEFGQKKTPSRYITLRASVIEDRMA